MKNKYILLIFLLGSIGVVGGVLFKIQHWPWANVILISAIALKVVGVMMFFARLLFSKKGKEFLNS